MLLRNSGSRFEQPQTDHRPHKQGRQRERVYETYKYLVDGKDQFARSGALPRVCERRSASLRYFSCSCETDARHDTQVELVTTFSNLVWPNHETPPWGPGGRGVGLVREQPRLHCHSSRTRQSRLCSLSDDWMRTGEKRFRFVVSKTRWRLTPEKPASFAPF